MALRINSRDHFNYFDRYVSLPVDSLTVPDMNLDVATLLRDFTRDPRNVLNYEDVENDDDWNTPDMPGSSRPFVDELTEVEDMRQELTELNTNLSKSVSNGTE